MYQQGRWLKLLHNLHLVGRRLEKSLQVYYCRILSAMILQAYMHHRMVKSCSNRFAPFKSAFSQLSLTYEILVPFSQMLAISLMLGKLL